MKMSRMSRIITDITYNTNDANTSMYNVKCIKKNPSSIRHYDLYTNTHYNHPTNN